MITYLYWALVVIISLFACFGIGRYLKWKIGILVGLATLFLGWLAYHFHYEQLFVKNYGGVMSLSVPEGQMHIHTTWKDNHIWIENYDPKENVCIFSEYSKGHLLQGVVTIKNCNPVQLAQ